MNYVELLDLVEERIFLDLKKLKCVCDTEESDRENRLIIRRVLEGNTRFIRRIRVRLKTNKQLERVKSKFLKHIQKLPTGKRARALETLAQMKRVDDADFNKN